MTKLHNELLRDIGALARAVHALSDLSFKELALQRGQFIFLTRVCENAGINQNDLSLLLKVDKSTTAKAIQKLVAAGYVTRQRGVEDQRHWKLFPTPAAQAVYDQIIAEENNTLAICLQNFTPSEQKDLFKLVKKMGANIENHWQKTKI